MIHENIYRTHFCCDISENLINKKVKVAGWIENIRDHGGVCFLDLRDQYGNVQLVLHDETLLKDINRESAISATGTVTRRDEINSNPKIKTGTVEIISDDIKILGKSVSELPFEVVTSTSTKEELRLKYRFLDLRNKKVHDNIMLRSKVMSFIEYSRSSIF